jgi:hypothetical protein
MKRSIAVVVILALATVVLITPEPAQASGRFWGGFVAGGLAGLILGGALATPQYVPPAAVYPYPAPPGYAAPPPGYYGPAPGYPGTAPVYVPPQWVWNGYQWVWQQGYWRYY